MGFVYPFNLREIGNATSIWLGIQPYELFFYIFLPPLLLDAALKIDWHVFKKVGTHRPNYTLGVNRKCTHGIMFGNCSSKKTLAISDVSCIIKDSLNCCVSRKQVPAKALPA